MKMWDDRHGSRRFDEGLQNTKLRGEERYMEKSKAKELVIRAGKEIAAKGLIAGTWGNISCKTDEKHFVITASGRDYETLTEDEVIEMDIDTLSCAGEVTPSSEKRVHREIYRLRDDAKFIIHTHQHNASAVSAMGQYHIKPDREYDGIGEFVQVSEYGLPGTSGVADKVAEAVQDSIGKAVIMSNHGAVVYGGDYEEALQIAENLEEACGNYLKGIGVEPWDGDEEHFREKWNTSPAVMKYIQIRDTLPAYLDDFAQLIGPAMRVIDDDEEAITVAEEEKRPVLVRGRGAMCNGERESDAAAVSMVIEKNARAALAGQGVKAIGRDETILMRQAYLHKYSKLKDRPAEGSGAAEKNI